MVSSFACLGSGFAYGFQIGFRLASGWLQVGVRLLSGWFQGWRCGVQAGLGLGFRLDFSLVVRLGSGWFQVLRAWIQAMRAWGSGWCQDGFSSASGWCQAMPMRVRAVLASEWYPVFARVVSAGSR